MVSRKISRLRAHSGPPNPRWIASSSEHKRRPIIGRPSVVRNTVPSDVLWDLETATGEVCGFCYQGRGTRFDVPAFQGNWLSHGPRQRTRRASSWPLFLCDYSASFRTNRHTLLDLE